MDALIVGLVNHATVRPYPPSDDFGPKSRWQFWSLDGHHFLAAEAEHRGTKWYVPSLTRSLDACSELAADHGFYLNVEPRFHIEGERVDYIVHALRPRWQDWTPVNDEWFDRYEGRHANRELAAVLALVRALRAQQEAGQ